MVCNKYLMVTTFKISFAISAFSQRNQNQKKLNVLCVKKINTIKKTTKPDKQDTANVPFHNRPNVYKSSLTVLPDF